MKHTSSLFILGMITLGIFLSLGFTHPQNAILLSLAITNVSIEEATRLDQEVSEVIQRPVSPHHRPRMPLRHRPRKSKEVSAPEVSQPTPPLPNPLPTEEQSPNSSIPLGNGAPVKERKNAHSIPRSSSTPSVSPSVAVPDSPDLSDRLLEDAQQVLQKNTNDNQMEDMDKDPHFNSQGSSPNEEDDRLYAYPGRARRPAYLGHNKEQEYRYMKQKQKSIKTGRPPSFDKPLLPGHGGLPPPIRH